MTTYLVKASYQGLSVLVDRDDDDRTDLFQIAKKFAGDRFTFFDQGESVHVPVPDDCKGILFQSDDELYERVPVLKPQTRRRRKSKS